MSLRIAPLQARHIEAAADIEKVSFSMPWSRAMLMVELDNPLAFYLAAEEGDTLAGYAGMHVILDEGYITNVATTPRYRRRGVASRLLEGLLAQAEGQALSFLTLEVRVSNLPAIALYEKHGFRKLGLRPRYYEKPREDALIMTAYLKGQ
ncbi:MAG: ribosomal protein S18-alanine N-acetyltransferase [Oscillospiraceae bacterium]|nr:ribosomal protein S18-alanine N-acetyltransferase [Oscillospiraceae bacterium]